MIRGETSDHGPFDYGPFDSGRGGCSRRKSEHGTFFSCQSNFIDAMLPVKRIP